METRHTYRSGRCRAPLRGRPNSTIAWLFVALLALFVLAISSATEAQTSASPTPQTTVRLKGTISPEISKASLRNRLDQNEQVQFAITLPVRKQAELDDYLKHLYTPGDPLYKKYLYTGEFAGLFGPTREDYDKVIEFAKRSGLRIVKTHSNRMVLDVAGPSAVVEKALSVRMMHFQSANGRIFHAPDQEPAVPADVVPVVAGVAGLDESAEPKCNLMSRPLRSQSNAAPNNPGGHGPGGYLSPADIKTAYNLNGLTQDGTGQTIALFEKDGFYASDINAYDDQFGLPHGTVTRLAVGDVSGFPTPPTATTPDPTGVIECTMDIELAKALAPNAQIFVYEGTNDVSIWNTIASDNSAQQISTSWYISTDSGTAVATRNAENTAFQQIAAQGQTLYGATGDYGDKVKTGTDSSGNPILVFGVQDPSAQPYITAVGGTTLTIDADTGAYKSETAWTGDTAASGGSTGGVSTVWSLPNYQSLLVSPGSGGSSSFRNLPDVSLDSDPNTGYPVYRTSGYPTASGSWAAEGGTSAAAPLWAAYTALVNQNRAALGTGKLGFANPTLYFVAHAHYVADFHDIATGNNGTYSAVSGYDNVTGWGTFNGGNMFSDLTRDAAVFWVDANYTGSLANGGQNTPFKKITDALNTAVNTIPTLIYIRGAAYNETFTTSKPVVLVNNGNGNATLGSSTVH